MIYYTGDIHRSKKEILELCNTYKPSKKDTIVILGDVGANYYRNLRDTNFKKTLSAVKPTILCIHGNHEIRPHIIPTYKTKAWNGGIVWYEEEFPNLLFAKDGEIFNIEGIKHLVIGGAYSIDKFYRIVYGYGWWSDEQPSDEIKAYVEKQVQEKAFDVILSHTCPYKYEPTEAFLPGYDQSTIDSSTEEWLNKIEDMANYKAWFCGHWHIDKRIDKMHFLFHGVETSEMLLKEWEKEDEMNG